MLKKRYDELDALRGIAALYVVLFHFTLGQKNVQFFNLGVSAVDLFFLISGFVIFMSINNVSSGRQFVINRVSRLYPTYWACVTFTFGMKMLLKAMHFPLNHEHHIGIIDYLGNLTMFQYYLGIPNLEVPYWTMLIEMLFYILVLVLYKFHILKHISLIGCAINTIIIVNYVLITNKVIPNYTAYFPLANHFALFFAGINFYQIITATIKKTTGYAIIFFCLATQITVYKFAGSDPEHITYTQYIGALLVYFLIFILFVNGKLKFIIWKPLLFLGKISFALYLVHRFFFGGLIGYFSKFVGFWPATLVIAIPSAILVATAITIYIEKPFGIKLKAFLKARS